MRLEVLSIVDPVGLEASFAHPQHEQQRTVAVARGSSGSTWCGVEKWRSHGLSEKRPGNHNMGAKIDPLNLGIHPSMLVLLKFFFWSSMCFFFQIIICNISTRNFHDVSWKPSPTTITTPVVHLPKKKGPSLSKPKKNMFPLFQFSSFIQVADISLIPHLLPTSTFLLVLSATFPRHLPVVPPPAGPPCVRARADSPRAHGSGWWANPGPSEASAPWAPRWNHRTRGPVERKRRADPWLSSYGVFKRSFKEGWNYDMKNV